MSSKFDPYNPPIEDITLELKIAIETLSGAKSSLEDLVNTDCTDVGLALRLQCEALNIRMLSTRLTKVADHLGRLSERAK